MLQALFDLIVDQILQAQWQVEELAKDALSGESARGSETGLRLDVTPRAFSWAWMRWGHETVWCLGNLWVESWMGLVRV